MVKLKVGNVEYFAIQTKVKREAVARYLLFGSRDSLTGIRQMDKTEQREFCLPYAKLRLPKHS